MGNFKIIIKHDYEYLVNISLHYIDNDTYYFSANVLNPPQSFWDNYKKIEDKTIDKVLIKVAFELNLAIEKQLMN